MASKGMTVTACQFALQTLGLLPVEMDAGAVARFLRCCPGLNKQTIGELLGEYDEFFLEVLRHFTDTFDFTGTKHLRTHLMTNLMTNLMTYLTICLHKPTASPAQKTANSPAE